MVLAVAFLSCFGTIPLNSEESFPEVRQVPNSKSTPEIIRIVQQYLKKDHYPNCTKIVPIRSADLFPPHMERVEVFPAGTTWSETWIVSVCGTDRIHHINFAMLQVLDQVGLMVKILPAQTAALEGRVQRAPIDASRLPAVAAVQDSNASPETIRQIQEFLHSVYYTKCPALKPVKALEFLPAEASAWKKLQNGNTWAETWLVETCDGPKKHHIDFYVASIRGQLTLINRVQPALGK